MPLSTDHNMSPERISRQVWVHRLKRSLQDMRRPIMVGGASCPMSSGVCGCAVCLGSVLSPARFVFIEFFMVHGVVFGSALLPANHTEVIYIASWGTPGSRMKPSMTVTAADRGHQYARRLAVANCPQVSARPGELRLWKCRLCWV